MAPEIQRSDIVLSQSGRDQGRMMVVLDTDADYLLLADGRLRRVESPKRKKRKHVRFCIPWPGGTGPPPARRGEIVKQ